MYKLLNYKIKNKYITQNIFSFIIINKLYASSNL